MMHDIKELKELNKQVIKQAFVEHSKKLPNLHPNVGITFIIECNFNITNFLILIMWDV
jgi:hypothetical protein